LDGKTILLLDYVLYTQFLENSRLGPWNSFIHSFIQTISVAPLQVHFYSEALPIQHGYCAGVSRRITTGNCELRTCPRSVYMAARAGVEPTTFRLKAIDSTKAPPRPTDVNVGYSVIECLTILVFSPTLY